MHVAIIMDGNGRWAQKRALPRRAGHRAGADAVDRIVQSAARQGVGTLTLYALSSDNWRRPQEEVAALLELLRRYLLSQTRRCLEHSIRLNVIGRRDRLESSLLRAIEWSERCTSQSAGMHLRIAVDYSSQDTLVAAARLLASASDCGRDAFQQALATVNHSTPTAPEVDLVIRTDGDHRLSDFLLWESAYAELYFTDCLWPDFNDQGLRLALSEFARRERRFGNLTTNRTHELA
jgi:undecaprenyl diphosphate synthase